MFQFSITTILGLFQKLTLGHVLVCVFTLLILGSGLTLYTTKKALEQSEDSLKEAYRIIAEQEHTLKQYQAETLRLEKQYREALDKASTISSKANKAVVRSKKLVVDNNIESIKETGIKTQQEIVDLWKQ